MITNSENSNVDSMRILREFYLGYMEMIGGFFKYSMSILGIFYSYYSVRIPKLLGLNQS